MVTVELHVLVIEYILNRYKVLPLYGFTLRGLVIFSLYNGYIVVILVLSILLAQNIHNIVDLLYNPVLVYDISMCLVYDK